eukprot:COSAG02_NODE_576_length_20112_cov_13.577625_3_plen_2119_part_00
MADEPSGDDEAAVQAFLEELGRGDTAPRVIQALPSLTTDGSTWVLELQAMELDGELDTFLDACTSIVHENEEAPATTSSAQAVEVTPEDGCSDAPGQPAVTTRPAPSASPRNASEVDDSMEAAVELAAAVALQSGIVAEEMFAVRGGVKGTKKSRDMQLKVGQMSLQLLHEGALLDSWRYPDLADWEFIGENEETTGKLTLRLRPTKKKGDEDLEFDCSIEVGTRCCELMRQHATVMYEEEKRKQEAKHQQQREHRQKMLLALRGEYTVSSHCLMVRESAALDSPKIDIVEPGETVTVVDAVIIQGRTRVHVVSDGVKVRSLSDSQLTSVDGWGSWQSSSGANLLLERLPRTPQRESLQTAHTHGGTMQYCLGEYVTEQADGVLVRASDDVTSDELCTVAAGERILAVEAKFVGERLWLRVTSNSVKLVAEPGQPDQGPVNGWVTLRNATGTRLLKKVDPTIEASDNEIASGDEDEFDDGGDTFEASSTPPMVTALVLQGSIQERIEDALSPKYQDLHGINLVLEQAAAKKFKHPSVQALQTKAMSLKELGQKKAAPQPASSSIPSAHVSVAEDGISSVVGLAGQAAAELGDAGEKMFRVAFPSGGKKPERQCQLKVGQMGVQVFDGPKMLDSYLYNKLAGWEFKAGKRMLVLVIAASASPSQGGRQKTAEFGCTAADGARICKLMTEHATAIAKQQRSETKQHLASLQGKYTVTTPNGVLMRAQKSPQSYKVGIVANHEELEVIEAVLTGGRTRLHAKGKNVCMDDGRRQDVDGWISLQTVSGTTLVVKSDTTLAGAIVSSRSRQPSPPTPGRLQSRRRHSFAIGVSRSPELGSPQAQFQENSQKVGVLEVQVKQSHIEGAAEQLTLRCEPLALHFMDGSRCVSSIAYRTLVEWEVLSSPIQNAPRKLALTFNNGDTIVLQCVRPGDAEKVSFTMTKEAEKLARHRSPSLAKPMSTQPRDKMHRPADEARGLISTRRASIAIGSGMGAMPKSRKAFIKNSAFMKQTDDENSFMVKQTTPKLCDVTLMLHDFGLQVSVHLSGQPPVTYTYDRLVSWRVLPSGDLCLKVLSLDGDLEVFNFATADAQKITELLTQFSGADPITPTTLHHGVAEEVVEPGGRYECVDTCAVTAEWERTSDQTGQVVIGQVVEVAESRINHQKQWRVKISRAWNDCTCTAPVPSFADGWVSLKSVNGEPNFLPLSGEQTQAAQPSLNAVQQNESPFWRETRLLEEAERRARDGGGSDGSSMAVVEPIRMSKKMMKPSRSKSGKPADTSDPSVGLSISDSQELEDPVSPRFLQDSAYAVAATDDWSADERIRLQEQHAVQHAEQQRKIASLEMQIIDLNKELAEARHGDSTEPTRVAGAFQSDLKTARQQASIAIREKEKIELQKIELEKHAVEQLAKTRALEEQVQLLDSQITSDASKAGGDEISVAIETAAEATKRVAAVQSRAETAEMKLALQEQEKQQLQVTVSELQQQLNSTAEPEGARNIGGSERIAELEASRVSNERCIAALSEELDHATGAMRIHHEKVCQLTAAHSAAVDQIDVLEQQNLQLEKRVADQDCQIREFEAQQHDLEQVRLQHDALQEQKHQNLIGKVSSLEAKVADEEAAQLSLRRANDDLKVQLQTLQMTHTAHPTQETARVQLTALQAKSHKASLEIEALRTELARSKRLVAETEIEEAKAKAQAAEAHGRNGLLAQELQVTKEELHAQRAVAIELKRKVAEMEALASPDSQAAMIQRELESLRAEHTGLHDKLQTEVALCKELEHEKEGLSRTVSANQESRQRLEDEARAGWEKADAEAGLREDMLKDKRAMQASMQAEIDELTRDLKRQHSILDATMQRHEDAQRKLKAETERSHAAELSAQHVASRARDASAEMRSNMVDIQRKYETQLTAVRVEKAKFQVAYDQAVLERQRIQDWVHEHMAATQERLLNSSAAVEASEKARVELQPRLEKSESEARGLKEQLRRVARESALAQQQAAAQLEHLRSMAQAERGELQAQVADMATALEAQRKKTAAERQRREASERRVESELEAARVAEQNAAYAISDVKSELGTTLQQAELEMARIHREEIDRLRIENANLEGQIEHSVRICSQSCDAELLRMRKLTESF